MFRLSSGGAFSHEELALSRSQSLVGIVPWRRFAGTRRAILLSPSRTSIRWKQQEESWFQERTRGSELYISEIVGIFTKVRCWGTPFLRRACPLFGGGARRGARRRGRELAVLNGIGPESVSQTTGSNCVPAIAFRPACSISSGSRHVFDAKVIPRAGGFG